ncbi:MAG: Lrp/AsnC family transcriptional regulator [Lachnospiraceae bacterium]|nr:Lrp/AsnC family transcriptional regulator [Lachnospiraceae bacterium]
MDHIDRQIVSILQKNARTPLKVIAEKAYLSSPAVSARIERLEKAGIITGYSARVNVERLGYHIMAFINLEVQPKQKHQFYPFIESCPNVLECSCVTGQFSMLIKVAFKSTMELDQFIGRLQDYGRTSTQIVFSTPVGPRGIQVLEEEEESHGGKEE